MKEILREGSGDALLAWLGLGVVVVAIGWSVRIGAIAWTLFGALLVAVLVTPAVAYRTPAAIPPWPVGVLAAVSYAVAVVAPWTVVSRVAVYVTVAALALVVVTEIDAFTPVRMNRGFAVALVVMATVTAAGVWELGKWTVDLAAGTRMVESNEALMRRLVTAAGAGLVAGAVFDRYLRNQLREEFLPGTFEPDDAEDQVDSVGDSVSDLLEDLGLSTARQRRLTRALQGLLAAIAVVGVVGLNLTVAVNASIGLAATFLPGLLQRDSSLDLDVGLTLWIAVPVALHALGSLFFYQTVWGWHNLAHATSGTLIAGVGYTGVRSLEDHTDAVAFPPKFAFIIVVLFVFSAGVFWEIAEFALDNLATALGTESLVLAQHGLADTMSDLVADTVGALLVAAAATVYRLR